MKNNQNLLLFISVIAMGVLLFSCNKEMIVEDLQSPSLKNGETGLSPIEQLGKALYFDDNLSVPGKMACAACHAPESGFTGPDEEINALSGVYPGVIHTRSGNRKPPSAAYAGDSPVLYYDEDEGLWIGGMFWDGRATGWTLGDPLAEQAMGPFLNSLEQNVPGARQVIIKVKNSDYAELFMSVFPDNEWNNIEVTYENIARAIAAYERSYEVNPFSSRFDAYIAGNTDALTEIELNGLDLFNGAGKCNLCHLSEGEKPLFTDFTYDNLGTPKNINNPFYNMPRHWNPDGINWIDPGLGGFLKSIGEAEYMAELGKHKVPTLRNVFTPGLTKAYMHNGVFKSLEEVVHFYNTRDVEGEGWEGVPWAAPEVTETVNTDELGNLGLTLEEEAAIVAFMKTLTDGYYN